jgi:hypothetical protein
MEDMMEQWIAAGIGFLLFIVFFWVFAIRQRTGAPEETNSGCGGGAPCTKCAPGIRNDTFPDSSSPT